MINHAYLTYNLKMNLLWQGDSKGWRSEEAGKKRPVSPTWAVGPGGRELGLVCWLWCRVEGRRSTSFLCSLILAASHNPEHRLVPAGELVGERVGRARGGVYQGCCPWCCWWMAGLFPLQSPGALSLVLTWRDWGCAGNVPQTGCWVPGWPLLAHWIG